MPKFNRRGFLHLISAAGVAPLLPALPTRAVAASSAVPTSKALWAAIYAKSGSVPKFVETAKGMGLSNAAVQSVSARSVGVRLSLSAATAPITRNTASKATRISASEQIKQTRDLLGDLSEGLPDETQDNAGPETHATQIGDDAKHSSNRLDHHPKEPPA